MHHPWEVINLFAENEDLSIDIHLPLYGNKHARSTGIRETTVFFLSDPSSSFIVLPERADAITFI